MPNVMNPAAPTVQPRRLPVAAVLTRAWSATRAAGVVLAEAFAEARAMQRAAYRRYPFLDS